MFPIYFNAKPSILQQLVQTNGIYQKWRILVRTLDSKKLKGEVNVRYLQKYDKCAILRNFPR